MMDHVRIWLSPDWKGAAKSRLFRLCQLIVMHLCENKYRIKMIRRMCTHNILFIGCTTHIRFWPSIEILYGVFKKKKMKFHQWIIWGESTQPARAPKHQQKKTQRNSLSMMVRGDFCFGVFFFFSIRPHHIHIDRELYTAMAGGRIFKNPLKSFSIMVMIVYVRYTYSLFIIYTARDRLRLSVIGSDQKGNMLTHIPLHSCWCCCAHFFRSRLLCARLLFNKWRRHESLASNSLFFPYILYLFSRIRCDSSSTRNPCAVVSGSTSM
jgi:hypothetical protein